MTTTTKTLLQTAYVSNSATAVYTVPGSGAKAILKEIIICNVTTSEQTVTLYTVNTGGSTTDASAICKDLKIPAKSTIWLEEITTIMEASSEFRAVASASSSVTLRISGVEIT